MRLLNVTTHQLEDTLANNSNDWPSYTILSHTWGEEEVSFQDLTSGNAFRRTTGYQKLVQCCETSRAEGFEHTWIDTCCIDKSSSAELSEAINSMFIWYSRAQVCYAYLSDVGGDDNPEAQGSSFRQSRWFRRGWTLQELLAPMEVVFFDRDWVEIGTKTSLAGVISEVTRIAVKALHEPLCGLETVAHTCQSFSVAQKMSWAALRETTREEDRAYSLLGLFEVNMPLLYGEGGEKAFLRLQREIMKQSSDDSIFAWSRLGRRQWATVSLGPDPSSISMLAWRPELFYSGCVIQTAAAVKAAARGRGTIPKWLEATKSSDHTEHAYEEHKDFLSLRAPILGFSEEEARAKVRLFRLCEDDQPDSTPWHGGGGLAHLEHASLAEVISSPAEVIAVINCCCELGRVGIVLSRRQDGTYVRKYLPEPIFIMADDLPQPELIRIRHRRGLGDPCAGAGRVLPRPVVSLDVVAVRPDGYSIAGSQFHDSTRTLSFSALALRQTFVQKEAFAILYRHRDGASERNPNIVLAVSAGRLAMKCLAVGGSEEQWAKNTGWNADGGWHEFKSAPVRFALGPHRRVCVRVREVYTKIYLFVSFFSANATSGETRVGTSA